MESDHGGKLRELEIECEEHPKQAYERGDDGSWYCRWCDDLAEKQRKFVSVLGQLTAMRRQLEKQAIVIRGGCVDIQVPTIGFLMVCDGTVTLSVADIDHFVIYGGSVGSMMPDLAITGTEAKVAKP